jgi:hypothetical protein
MAKKVVKKPVKKPKPTKILDVSFTADVATLYGKPLPTIPPYKRLSIEERGDLVGFVFGSGLTFSRLSDDRILVEFSR